MGDQFIAASPDAFSNLIAVGRQVTRDGDREFLVTRMSDAGILDPYFGHAGYVLEHRADDPRAVAVDSQGRIVVAGVGINNSVGLMMTRHLPFQAAV